MKMTELDEILDDLIGVARSDLLAHGLPETPYLHEGFIEAKQAILALIQDEVRKARIEELNNLSTPNKNDKLVEAFNGGEKKLSAFMKDEIRKARIDFLSDMIIECYSHDSPMDIIKELEEERRQLEAQLSEGKE